MKSKHSLLLFAALFATSSLLAAPHTLFIPGKDGPAKDGPGKGKHIVLISGDEEYRSEEALPMLAKILSHHHGFDCTVLFAWDSTGSYIDPNNQAGILGWDALEKADLMIISTRFRRPTAEDAAHVTAFLNAGKPVIGLRTATHAFTGNGNFGGTLPYGQFGRKILGEQWINHHGQHKREGARGVIESANASHPILNAVKDVFGPSDVYGVVNLTEANTILLRGAVTQTMAPNSPLVEGKKNDPMMPLAWLHPYTAPNGTTTGTSFCTTMGASVDLVSEDLRRLIVNTTFFLTGLEVPAKADASYVDSFYPSFFGFIKEGEHFKNLNLKAADFGPGKTPLVPDPKGTPPWPHRDIPPS